MNEIQRDILALIAKLKAYEKGVVDAKWRNKLIARMEENEVLASRLMNQAHAANQPWPTEPPAGQKPIGCICPEGAVDSDCVVHGIQPTSLENIRF